MAMFPIKRWLRFKNLPPFLDKTIWKTNGIHHRLGSKVILSVICRQFPPPRSILETQPYRHLFLGAGIHPIGSSIPQLVGGLEHFLFSISYMGCHPSHWLSYFSRWLLHHQPGFVGHLLVFLGGWVATCSFIQQLIFRRSQFGFVQLREIERGAVVKSIAPLQLGFI